MRKHLIFLSIIVLGIISCKKYEPDNFTLEGTIWHAISSSGVYESNQRFEFDKSSFVLIEGKYQYNGVYNLSSSGNIITLAFKGVNPSAEIKNKATTAYISFLDSTIIYEEKVYSNKSVPTYSDLRKKEKMLIKNYISRNELNILAEEPDEDYAWGEKDYYLVEGYDELYFHLRRRGDSIKVVAKDVIVTRYKKFDLTENPDTLSFWTTMDQAHPYEFQYCDLSTCEAIGWHEAVRLMKYSDSECEVIVPSKLGFDADQMSVTPYVYILKIKVKK